MEKRKNSKKFNELDPFRLIGIAAFVAMLISVIIDTVNGIENPYTIVPHVEIVTYIVNFIVLFFSLLVIIFPSKKKFIVIACLMDSIYTVLIGYEFVGIILYGFFILLLFGWGFFISKTKLKICVILGFWFFILLALIPFGLYRFFFAVGVFFFYMSTYACVYSILFSKLSHLLPDVSFSTDNNCKRLPKPGSLLIFSDMPFTERQIQCIFLTMKGMCSYKKIADTLCISVSVIKKEMLEIYRFFNVKNKEMLYILISQYNPVYPNCIEKLKD